MHVTTTRGNDDESRSLFRRGEWLPAVHLFALWAFAVAQPIFDLVGREPDFLVSHPT